MFLEEDMNATTMPMADGNDDAAMPTPMGDDNAEEKKEDEATAEDTMA
jgi:hypothetical protein